MEKHAVNTISVVLSMLSLAIVLCIAVAYHIFWFLRVMNLFLNDTNRPRYIRTDELYIYNFFTQNVVYGCLYAYVHI